MSDFGLSDSSGGGLDSAKRAQLMDQVKSQIAVAAAQELLQVRQQHACRLLTFFVTILIFFL